MHQWDKKETAAMKRFDNTAGRVIGWLWMAVGVLAIVYLICLMLEKLTGEVDRYDPQEEVEAFACEMEQVI